MAIKTTWIFDTLVDAPGNNELWRTFWDRYQRRLFGWLRKQKVDEENAGDIVQAAFLAIFRAIKSDKFTFTPQFRGWIWQVASNELVNHIRKNNKWPGPMDQASLEMVEAEATQEFEEEYLRDVYEVARDNVRPDFEEKTWACYVLKREEGRSAAEVASQFDITEDSVRRNASRVLNKIKDEIAKIEAAE